ncbi:ATP-binding protein [Streptomyces sp. NPDC007856]|uniref:ATP-binding protein n=1 Tax=Streptomyces sp. NPDC007856 TaxID=3364781 RepID=UPI0036A87570
MTKPHLADEAQRRTPTHDLTLRFSSTRRGARLARQLAVQQFTEWTSLPYDSDPARTVALVTAELAANAIRHGSLPGRDFRLTLLHLPETFRVEVTDTRPERLPGRKTSEPTPPDAPAGRGLLLVEAYAERWGWERRDAYTKTVWATVALQPPYPSQDRAEGHDQARPAGARTSPA